MSVIATNKNAREYVRIDSSNLASEHICCALGADAENQFNANAKKQWMASQFENGLVFYRLKERGKVFIEYMPSEACWKPVVADNHLVIDCLWVSGKFKGQGHSKNLLAYCIDDAKRNNKDGIVVVVSNKKKPFLTDKSFYLKHGFEVVDNAEPYFELLEYKIHPSSATPRFSASARQGICGVTSGLFLVYSNQCPFMERYVERIRAIAEAKKIPCIKKKLTTPAEAQQQGSPFGTLGIYYDGTFLTHELLSGGKLEKFLEEKGAP